MPVKNRALYDVGTVGDTLSVEVPEVELHLLEVEKDVRHVL
jgi:hypothetical protein